MSNTTIASMTQQEVGKIEGSPIQQFTLNNASGMSVKIINYGGAVTSIVVPDKQGNRGEVALGFETPLEYELPQNPHFGSITGRFANRLSKGKFTIDGTAYQVSINNNGNTLHGGIKGFNRKVWDYAIISDNRLKLTYVSKDGEEGFPGNCAVEVMYELTPDNALKIDYSATTDKATPVNITNHSYFNLSAGQENTVLSHQAKINAGKYVPVNEEFLPTGELAAVHGTIMDFNQLQEIGKHVHEVYGGGYDHTYVLEKDGSGVAQLAGEVYHPGTGRVLKVFTTEPGVQFYTGNFLDGTITGRNGVKYIQHAGFCLEAQHFPDSPNQPSFPNTILRPGERYTQTTIYQFSVR